ncbi:OsmC family protein [Planobispora takensis]|uniref:Osmotically inducible protein C n=1 Tax=Planobispora takensis TaxID=1367882 RepID=A0A8J3WTU7_9ACTN|nr:OsmC family protein [Planobispora takensis]GII00758.1 osmotically inducible protein C [Planobispora takensis]
MASVKVERTEDGFVARNDRGAEVVMGSGDEQGAFTPVELLLAALGGCNIVTVEPLTAQRGHRLVRLEMTVHAEKVETSKLGPITITYDVELPEGDEKADEVFRAVAHRVEERYCTVSRALRDETQVILDLPG